MFMLMLQQVRDYGGYAANVAWCSHVFENQSGVTRV